MKVKVTKRRSLFKIEYIGKAKFRVLPEVLWNHFMKADEFARWNSEISDIKGEFVQGEKICFQVPQAGDKQFRVKVAELLPQEKMLWKNGFKWSLQGIRSYEFIKRGYGTTEVVIKESFTGLLVPWFIKKLPDLSPMFKTFFSDLYKVLGK
ncbi:hypothetical protein E9993_11905 [Labilibacter sediminis]|nr:hypothetical protein E9993_11905 [Labilibacter sediminis]